ncbi:MAG: NINE protein [Candidatus Izemoplasmatales bacterium]|jgi:hypothetical protein|nr:NINE protein [Candidatus Izemoplasmatales bacterium]
MAKSVECNACGNVFSSEEAKCPYCGAVNANKETLQQPNPVYQQAPQQPNPVYQQAPQPQVVYVQQPQLNVVGKRGPFDKTTAIILCILLGWLGGHKFYEGKTGAGILYLFTCGLFFIGVVIDLLTLLGKPSKYYL